MIATATTIVMVFVFHAIQAIRSTFDVFFSNYMSQFPKSGHYNLSYPGNFVKMKGRTKLLVLF